MSSPLRAAFLSLSLLLVTITALAGTPRAEHVFIVSFDGGKPAVIAQSEMPVLKAMAAEGAHTWVAQTIMPSITLPSHTSMLTGVTPAKHHILWNDWKPELGLVKVPTIFSLAKEHGFTTAMFVGKVKFRHLDLPGTVDAFVFPLPHDLPADAQAAEKSKVEARPVAEAFASALAGGFKPNLCFIHFSDTDTAGHKYGWGSPEQIKAFADCDAALKIIMDAIRKAGLTDSSVVILTADHGGHDKTHGLAIPDDLNIPWIVWGKGVKPHLELTTPISTCDTAATALWLLNIPVPADFDGKPATSAFE
ncbi:MAG TPA: alkaline phosphatase family protein [Rariglobus sp.]|jgi:predicted AlkP superfamily pyrophosphatase or phosphodiesterase|nr:alkaline phosphatase family protein [Rariglobus sp.]